MPECKTKARNNNVYKLYGFVPFVLEQNVTHPKSCPYCVKEHRIKQSHVFKHTESI